MKHASELKSGLVTDKGMLVEMSREIDRISKNLAKLMAEDPPLPGEEDSPGTHKPESSISRREVSETIKARQGRNRFFSSELFADPAWDILLHLFHAELGQHRLSVSSACSCTDVPPTTCLRWLKVLENQDLVVRRPDLLDGRRIFLELSPTGSMAMTRYFQAFSGERPARRE